MPRGSRHKSHKQHKHNTKDSKEVLESEEDFPAEELKSGESFRKPKEENRTKKNSDSSTDSGKRKQSMPSIDLFAARDEEEYFPAKRHKDKAEPNTSDRWNGEAEGRGEVTEEYLEEKGVKSRASVVDLKGKSSRKSETKEEALPEIEEGKKGTGKSESYSSKRKLERESGKKEGHSSREGREKEKEKEREKEKEKKEISIEVSKSQKSHPVNTHEERLSSKHDGENDAEWRLQDELRNPDLEKELERRNRRRRDGSIDRDKCTDETRDEEERRMSSREDHLKNGKYKDDRQRNVRERDERQRDEKQRDEKQRDEREKDGKQRDERQRGERHRDERQREERHKDERQKDERIREEKQRDERSRDERHRDERSKEERQRDERPRDERQRDERSRDERQRDERLRDERQRDDKSRDERQKDERSRDDRQRDESQRDERHRDERYRNKHREDHDRDQRYPDENHKEERFSKDQNSDRTDRRLRDEERTTGNHYKRSKLKENDKDGSPGISDHSTRTKDTRGCKRSPDENSNHGDRKSLKGSTFDRENNIHHDYQAVDTRDKVKTQKYQVHSNVDNPLNKEETKCSQSSGRTIPKDHSRVQHNVSPNFRDTGNIPPVAEHHDESLSGERSRVKQDAFTGELPIASDVVRRLENDVANTVRGNIGRSPRSDTRASPHYLRNKSPSPASRDHRHSSRSSSRRSLDLDESGHAHSSSKDITHTRDLFMDEDRVLESPFDQHALDSVTQSEPVNGDATPAMSSSIVRTGEDAREPVSDRKASGRYRRSSEVGTPRQQPSPWKGIPNWNGPVTNSFLPFQPQVGPGPGGFPPVLPQFQAPAVFNVRPPMELTHAGLAFHMHDGDRFAGHGRSFGWRNPGADSNLPTHIHGWDGTGAFVDEPQLFGRPDWDQGRHNISNRAWDVNTDPWKGQNGANLEFAAHKEPEFQARFQSEDASWAGQTAQRSRQRADRFPAESIEIKRSDDGPATRVDVGAPLKSTRSQVQEPKKLPRDDVYYYLSQLDISSDLAGQDLHEKCLQILESKAAIEDGSTKLLKSSVRAPEGSLKYPPRTGKEYYHHNLSSRLPLFTETTDALYRKAMHLYEIQRDKAKATKSASASPESKLALISDMEPMNTSTTQNDLPKNSPVEKDEDRVSPANGDGICCPNIEQLEASASNLVAEDISEKVEGLEHGSALPTEGLLTSHASDSFSVVSEQIGGHMPVFEVLKPDAIEYSVGSSRIPDSPKSTH